MAGCLSVPVPCRSSGNCDSESRGRGRISSRAGLRTPGTLLAVGRFPAIGSGLARSAMHEPRRAAPGKPANTLVVFRPACAACCARLVRCRTRPPSPWSRYGRQAGHVSARRVPPFDSAHPASLRAWW